MKNKPLKWILYLGIVLLYFLHNDLWIWNDSQLVIGLPVGLFYHAVFCVMASALMVLLVNYAWPEHLEIETQTTEENEE